jgi:large subunit GTPase 1
VHEKNQIMPRNQGTSRKGKPKKEMRSAGFGKALQRSTVKRYTPKANGSSAHGQGMIATGAHTIGVVEESEGAKMKSVLEMDDLSDFLEQAQLANKDFQSEREQFLNIDNVAQEYVPTGRPTAAVIHEDRVSSLPEQNFSFHELSVPRRPAWTPGVTTAEELEHMENEAFLEWRRGVARREEEIAALAFESHGGGVAGASVTPYEKNLHVWRQLWRVLERSAVVLQIVDARNPLFYLSDDLRKYAMEELGKPMLMVVNKSDYLTKRQRKLWSEYFTKRGVDHLFFSAYEEQKKIDKAAQAAKKGEELEEEEQKKIVSDDESDSDGGNDDLAKESSDPAKEETVEKEEQSVESARPSSDDLLGITAPLTREELLNALDSFAKSHGCVPDEKYDNRIQYGMVGFPNVGKSSVINVLVGSSKSIHGVVRVGVAAQPGKTKHFQTLLLPDRSDMMLCDCPGLVFPSFVSSTADMIAAGVYPIAQMRDHWPVVSLICQRVPRDVLNAHYGIHIPEPTDQELREKGWTSKSLPPPTAEELLGTYCIARSMLAPASGVPDYQRASRVVVKDYSEGKLLYCHSPPSLGEGEGESLVAVEDDEYQRETLKTAIRNTSNSKKLHKLEQSLEVAAAKADHVLDEDFDDFDSILGDLDAEDSGKGDKRGKAHKSIKKWGKKGRKLRNKDPYGCHSDPDSVLQTASTGNGVIVNAGKYGGSYTRMNYAGAKAATPFEGRTNRPKKGRQ